MESPDKTFTETALIRDVSNILPGEFELLDYIGEGGHGIVFKARNKTLQQTVALKLIKNDGSTDMEKQLSRMKNEARMLAKLAHPNIVKVYQMGQCKDDTPFLVCEYIEGKTLQDFLQSDNPPTIEQLSQIFEQILDALSCSHGHGLIHRDIKPSNILITTDKISKALQVKVVDFGIARDFDAALNGPLCLTRTIQATGSAPYMSPEQCSGSPIDHRSDLYAVACVLFECLAGRPPFAGETPMHTRYMHIHEKVKLPSVDTDSNIREKAALYKICLAGLAKSPTERIQTADQFKRELKDACSNSTFVPRSGKKNKASNKIFAGTKLSNLPAWLLLPIAIASLLTGAGGIALFLLQNQSVNKSDSVELKQSKKHTEVSRMLAPLTQVAWCKDQFIRSLYFPELEQKRTALAVFDRLSETIPKISKGDKGLLFSAWILKAWAARILGLRNEREISLKQALSSCRTSNGKETIEAAYCYMQLANDVISQNEFGKFDQAQQFITKAITLSKDLEKLDTVATLSIPEAVDVREQEGQLYQELQIASSLAQRKDDLPSALKFLTEARREKEKLLGPVNSSDIVVSIASLQLKDNRAQALTLMEEHCNSLLAIETKLSALKCEIILNWWKIVDPTLYRKYLLAFAEKLEAPIKTGLPTDPFEQESYARIMKEKEGLEK